MSSELRNGCIFGRENVFSLPFPVCPPPLPEPLQLTPLPPSPSVCLHWLPLMGLVGPGALRLLRKWVLPWIFITTIAGMCCESGGGKAAWRGICHGRLNVYKRNIHPDAVISSEIGTWCFSVGTTSAGKKLPCCTARSSPCFSRWSDLQSIHLSGHTPSQALKQLITQQFSTLIGVLFLYTLYSNSSHTGTLHIIQNV